MLSIVQLSRFFVCVVLFKRQLIYINIAVFVCQELFLKSFMSFHKTNGEGGIWTLAPLLTTYSLSRGAPSASLGTSPKCPHHMRDILFHLPLFHCIFKTSQLWYCTFKENKRKSIQLWTSQAERVGFEPTRPLGQTVFKTASLWPLRYLSKLPVRFTG